MSSVWHAEDRSLRVEPAWVDVDAVVLGCRDRMDCAAVERAYRRLLCLGRSQAWPPPVGQWREDGRFMVRDGRHETLAAIMLGRRRLLVAWLAEAEGGG